MTARPVGVWDVESMVGDKATVVVEGSIVAAAEAAVLDVAAVVGYVLARTGDIPCLGSTTGLCFTFGVCLLVGGGLTLGGVVVAGGGLLLGVVAGGGFTAGDGDPNNATGMGLVESLRAFFSSCFCGWVPSLDRRRCSAAAGFETLDAAVAVAVTDGFEMDLPLTRPCCFLSCSCRAQSRALRRCSLLDGFLGAVGKVTTAAVCVLGDEDGDVRCLVFPGQIPGVEPELADTVASFVWEWECVGDVV